MGLTCRKEDAAWVTEGSLPTEGTIKAWKICLKKTSRAAFKVCKNRLEKHRSKVI